jgi:NAD(P)-dependent dehydrogenase (short-subunit alcohol dehydrogenase family)
MTAYSLFRLDGLKILVTGASNGLGRAIAIACAEAGASIILHGRSLDRLNEVALQLSGTGHKIFSADFSNSSQIVELADFCTDLNGIVHCAGVHGVAPMHLVQSKFLNDVMQVNFFAPIILTQRLLLKKKILPTASILFISSIASKTGKHGVGPYSASKAATLGAMRPLALEVSKHNIRVNALCPGVVRGGLFKGQEDWLDKEVAPTYPLGLGEPEDVAHAAVFFMSRASSKVTGTDFSIDGGVPFT